MGEIVHRPYNADRIKVKDLPICIVYFLWDNGKIVYVGKSFNGIRRIYQHLKSKKFDEFSYLECDKEYLTSIENFYIRRFCPKYNDTKRYEGRFCPYHISSDLSVHIKEYSKVLI